MFFLNKIFMDNHFTILQYLIDNPSLNIIDHNSEISVVRFKELLDKGYVTGINIGGSSSISFEYLEPRITFNGRKILASNS